MKKRILPYVCVLVFLLCFLAGCGCQHEWAEADCLAPKTCIHCGKTEGEALGHAWQEASCKVAKTCSRCGETEGALLPHTAGSILESVNPVTAERLSERHCKVCDAVLDSSSTPLDSFLTGEDTFMLTPNQFLERLSSLAKPYYPDFDYSLSDHENQGTPLTLVHVTLGDVEGQYVLQFHHTDTQIFHQSEFDDTGVLCVSFSAVGMLEEFEELLFEAYLNDDLMYIMGKTADPLFNEDDLAILKSMKFVSCMNTFETGDPYGYWVNRDMLHQFSHSFTSYELPTTGVESLLIYAVDSLDPE